MVCAGHGGRRPQTNMQNAHYDLTAAKVASPYTPLKPGLWRLDDWGGYLLVLPLASNLGDEHGQVLCLDINNEGYVEGQCLWHYGPNEQLAEPARVMRDDELDEESADACNRVRY